MKNKKLKPKFIPLDVVETGMGSIAVITEMSNVQNIHFQYSVNFIKWKTGDRNAWHDEESLKYINNIYFILIQGLEHPMGGFYDIEGLFKNMRNISLDLDKNYL